MRRPPQLLAGSLIASGALLVGGCASQAGGIDATTKTLLQRDVQNLTSAAASRDYAAARTAISTLNTDLTAAYAAGKISDTRLAQIQASILKLQVAMTAVMATPTPLPPTSPPSPPTPHGKDRQNGGDGGRGGD